MSNTIKFIFYNTENQTFMKSIGRSSPLNVKGYCVFYAQRLNLNVLNLQTHLMLHKSYHQ